MSNKTETEIAYVVNMFLPDLVNEVTKQMEKKNIEINPNTVIQVLHMAMNAVEGCPLKGDAQKDLAIKVVFEIANNSGLPSDQLALLKELIEGGLVTSLNIIRFVSVIDKSNN